jgi:hypothetical protein
MIEDLSRDIFTQRTIGVVKPWGFFVISLSGCVANWEWVVSKGAPWRELSNAPKNVGFR